MSPNGKVVRELIPDSAATSTERDRDGLLEAGEQFTTEFTNPTDATRFGGTFTYIGYDPAYSGAVAVEPSTSQIVTNFLYLLDQSGSSPNGKVVRELIPDSTATSTESERDGLLKAGEQFTTEFANPGYATRFGGNFTYIGYDPAFSGAVAVDALGNFYLFSNDGSIPIGAKLNGIEPLPLVLCFLAGTMIKCPTGERAIETLAIGDLVVTMDGRTVPVKWIGRQTIVTFFGPPEGGRPVRIRASAISDNVPSRDLCVTSDHALLIDDILVQAGALVNGTSICRMTLDELGQRFTVYHIETENHEIVLAEGTSAETFIDNVTRERFDNYAEFKALYGSTDHVMTELDQPRAMSHRQVPRHIHERLAERATGLGLGVEAAA